VIKNDSRARRREHVLGRMVRRDTLSMNMTDAQLALTISAASATIAVMSCTWTICWSVWQHRRLHSPRLTVLPANALPVAPGRAGEWCVSVTVVNDGGIAITLTSLKFVVRNDRRKRGFFPTVWVHTDPHPMPVKLTPGDKWTGLTELKSLQAVLIENFPARSTYALWVIATDASDRQYRARFSLSVA
jgi:hypothetical protein